MKKISFILIITILFIGLNSSRCKHEDGMTHLKIKNNANFSIYYALSYSYPDTSINKIGIMPYSKAGDTSQKINANSSVFVRIAILGISPITQMFIFDAHTIETTPWDSIVKHYMVLKRYQLTESDVEKMNWTITYPK
jgi:hypothetical protein